MHCKDIACSFPTFPAGGGKNPDSQVKPFDTILFYTLLPSENLSAVSQIQTTQEHLMSAEKFSMTLNRFDGSCFKQIEIQSSVSSGKNSTQQ